MAKVTICDVCGEPFHKRLVIKDKKNKKKVFATVFAKGVKPGGVGWKTYDVCTSCLQTAVEEI